MSKTWRVSHNRPKFCIDVCADIFCYTKIMCNVVLMEMKKGFGANIKLLSVKTMTTPY